MGFRGAFPFAAAIYLIGLLGFLYRYAPTEELVYLVVSWLVLLCLTGTALPFLPAVVVEESSLPLDGMR